MTSSEEINDWEKKQNIDLDSETFAIMAVIAFLILLFGICIGAIIVIKCKKLHPLYANQQNANEPSISPGFGADV